jgi:hypothetical protein
LETKDKGITLHPDLTKSFEVHPDCDSFNLNWVKKDALNYLLADRKVPNWAYHQLCQLSHCLGIQVTSRSSALDDQEEQVCWIVREYPHYWSILIVHSGFLASFKILEAHHWGVNDN